MYTNNASETERVIYHGFGHRVGASASRSNSADVSSGRTTNQPREFLKIRNKRNKSKSRFRQDSDDCAGVVLVSSEERRGEFRLG